MANNREEVEERLSVCWEGREALLLAELRREFPDDRHRVEGDALVLSELARSVKKQPPVIAFARQTLVDAVPLSALSVNAWAETFLKEMDRLIGDKPELIRIHIFTPTLGIGNEGMRRCELITRTARQQARRFYRRLQKRVVDEAAPATLSGEYLVQLMLVHPEKGFLSITSPEVCSELRYVLSPLAGGYIEIPEDKLPPSRAYRKLLEAQALYRRSIQRGESVVDLGATPGSWSFVALRAGAKVIAVDRAPLAQSVLQNPKLQFVRGDGFTYEPENEVDWMLCDIISYPERSLELLRRWVGERWCKNFCVTFKFKGPADLKLLDDLKSTLRESCSDFLLRNLHHNKNEVTAIGTTKAAV